MDRSAPDRPNYSTVKPGADSVVPPVVELLAGGPPVPAAGDQPTRIHQGLPAVRVIRGYHLVNELGGGAFGVVYRALSPGGVEVAVKEVRYPLNRPEAK